MSIKITKIGTITIDESSELIKFKGWKYTAKDDENENTIARHLFFAYIEHLMNNFDKFEVFKEQV